MQFHGRTKPSPRSHLATSLARLSWLVTSSILLLGGCAARTGAPPPDEGSPPQFVDEYELGVGDTIAVDVWKNPELSVTVPVRPDGRISVPLLGDVDVGGKTPETVAGQIEERLAQFVRNPQVSVIVQAMGSAEYHSRVRVTGAVAAPVSLPYRPGMTVLDVVLEAGGLSEFAKPAGTRLYRADGTSKRVNLKAIMQRGNLSTNYRLRPGDVLTVPETRL